jgi:hypothetical protein
MLHWLREHGCPWEVSKVCIKTARCASAGVLGFIIEQGEVLDAVLLTKALNRAGAFGQLRAAQWLRQHGAQWPTVLSYGHIPSVRQWSGGSLAWARAEGCVAPTTL